MERLQDQSHRRYNPLTGEWVLVSPHRTKRPWRGKTEKGRQEKSDIYDPSCYLCPGNKRAGGAINAAYENTYVFTNDFAALVPEARHISKSDDGSLMNAESVKGICRVVCFSPDHSLTLPLMNIESIVEIIRLWQREYKTLGANDFIEYVQIFENKGEIMGCSNPHPHGQIWATGFIPDEPRKEQENQKVYFDKYGKTLLTAYLEEELAANERIVLQNKHFVALVPFWATWPFETMIISREPLQDISLLEDDMIVSYAEVVKKLTTKYDNLFETSFPYSAGIHQAPTDGMVHPEWHFHMHFYPPLLRSATVKKFMVGFEMLGNPQRDITAEVSATMLGKVSGDRHYSELPDAGDPGL